MRRTSGAQFLYMTLTKAMREFLQTYNVSRSRNGAMMGREIAPLTEDDDKFNRTRNGRKSIMEADILAYVTKSLDNTLELGC